MGNADSKNADGTPVAPPPPNNSTGAAAPAKKWATVEVPPDTKQFHTVGGAGAKADPLISKCRSCGNAYHLSIRDSKTQRASGCPHVWTDGGTTRGCTKCGFHDPKQCGACLIAPRMEEEDTPDGDLPAPGGYAVRGPGGMLKGPGGMPRHVTGPGGMPIDQIPIEAGANATLID